MKDNPQNFSRETIIVTLIIAVLFMLSCVGGVMKMKYMDQIYQGVTFTLQQKKEFHCTQSSFWLPVGTTIGLAFLLFPKSFKTFFRVTDQFGFLLIRVIGLGFIALTVSDIWRSCNFLLQAHPW